MNRIFFLVGFSFITASFLCNFFPESFWIYILIGLISLTLIACFIKKFRKEKVIPISLTVCVFAVLINILNTKYIASHIRILNETDAFISGNVIDIPYKKNNTYNYIIKVDTLNNEKIKPFKIKLSSSTTLEAEAFDTFKGRVHFFAPEDDNHFNWKMFYKSKDIHILAYAYSYEPFEIIPQEKFNLFHNILKLRKKMLSFPKYIFSEEIGSIINGFLLGEKHSFPNELKEIFSNIGIYHIITTSAIHISILSQFFIWILKKLGFGIKSSSTLVSCMIVFFMALTGFTPSVMRSGIISIIYNSGILFFRKPDPINSLGISIILICLGNPYASLNVGLWLSIFSYLGIIILDPKINTFICEKLKIDRKNKFLHYFISLMSVSLSVTIFTFPLSVLYFKKTTFLFLISNILIIPISTVVLSSAALLQVCFILNIPQFITMPIGTICGVLTNVIVDIAKVLSQIPFGIISLDYLHIKIWWVCSAAIIGISLLFNNYIKTLKISLLISLCLFTSSSIFYTVLNYGSTKLAILNSYEGIALVLSEKFRKSVVIFYDDRFNDIYFKEYFLRNPWLPCDYFNIVTNTDVSQSNLDTIINKFRTLNVPIITLNNDVHNLWGHINITTKRIKQNIFILLQIDKRKFLVSCTGGNIDELPLECKNCDCFIATKLPINYEHLSSKEFIISSNKTNSEIFLNKLIGLNKKLFSTAHQGNIYIDVNKNDYKIRRFE